jgi:2-dehydro-3-deoxyglucarate aldolase/4-hydroxy-2-oxoheptanedioate aldolase
MGSQLKTVLHQDRLVRLYALGQLSSPKLVEMVGWSGGFDAVWFDQEHAGLTVGQIEECSRAARAVGLDSFVRLAATDYATVMRALEAGAGGVMAAMVRTLAQVVEVVAWAKFHPRGQRGVNGSGVDGRYGTVAMLDYFKKANSETVVGIQIEHIDAVEQVERIAAVPDIDFLFIGPADLSQSMGLPGEWEHPRVWQAVERIARASAAAGVPWAILPISPAHARRCVDLGCRILSLGLDVWSFQRGLRAFREDYSAFFTGG